jgi:hypothetical protein
MLASQYRPFWICLLLLLGVYLPSSSNGEITQGWTRFALTVICLLLLVLLSSKHGRAKRDLVWIGALILLLLLIFTPFSLLPIPVYGILVLFAIFSLLISIRLENIKSTRLVQRTFLLANVVNILLGFGILLHFPPVRWLIENYYAAGYSELVPAMLDTGKPVLTYATHSLAGLIHYLFFWVNLCAYRETGKRVHLWFAMIYMVFMLSLLSVSGVLFFGAAVFQLALTLSRRKFLVAAASTGLLMLVLLGTVKFLGSQQYFSGGITAAVGDIVSAQGNGFLGRYSLAGSLLPVYDYLTAHPFRPVGLTTDYDMLLLDSGPINYYMRGSILLLALMYAGLFLFLKRNLLDRRNAYFLFAVLLGFELGFSALTSFRAICVLPILIVYLNGLRMTRRKILPPQPVYAANGG